MKVTLMGIPVLVLLLTGCAAPEAEQAEESTSEAIMVQKDDAQEAGQYFILEKEKSRGGELEYG